jgi:hypothetical protein
MLTGFLPAAAAAVAAAESTAAAAAAAITAAAFAAAESTAAATAAESTARTTTAATGAGAILSLVHTQRATAHRVAVQGLDRTSRIFLRHFDKAETAGTTRITINRQGHRLDRTMLREQGTNRCLVCRERQVAYINFRHLWKHSLINQTNRPQPATRILLDPVGSISHLIEVDSAMQTGV